MTLSPNTVLEGRYRIEAMLSRGGMGTVYRAFDTNLETKVAIKENAFQTEEAVAQFKREALILARLRHPSLPRVIQHFTVADKQYLVMDFVEGADLWQIIENQRQPLNEKQALTYISQICDALTYLHNQSPPIVHRDIKPQNIKVTPDGRAVLVDFGIAKEYVSGEQTMTGARGVTAGFSPPEQYGDGGTTPASDIYSMGATMYALLTGKKPPDSVSLVVKTKQFIPVNQLNPAINPNISQAISWAMELDTTRRPPTIHAWQQRLQDIEVKDSVSTVASSGAAYEPTMIDSEATPARPDQAWLVDEQGNKYPLDPRKQLTIGRQSINDVRLNSKQVSRRHAIVTLQEERCMAYDQGSSNGTFINKKRVGEKGGELRAGDTLTIGSSHFRLERSSVSRPVPQAAQPVSVSQEYAPPPADQPSQMIWDDEAELGGIAGMTQMLTVNIAKKMEAMSNTQVTILAAGLIGGLVLATFLVGDFIRTNLPWIWNFFPFYLIAGPLAYVFSRRRGTALLVHVPTYVLILTIIWWPNVQLLAFFASGFVGGAIMEALFGVPKMPDWLRYPLGVTLAYLAGLFMLIILTRPIYDYWEIVGAALIGFLIYVISEVYKGVQKARSVPTWA